MFCDHQGRCLRAGARGQRQFRMAAAHAVCGRSGWPPTGERYRRHDPTSLALEAIRGLQRQEPQPSGESMKDPGLEQAIQQDHEASAAFVRGDPGPKKRLYSKSDFATLANPLGPPARGWRQVEAALDAAAAMLRDGEPTTFERISECETPDLAYIVEIERNPVKVGRTDQLSPVELRVTTVFRREGASWRVVHRHADPITTPRAPESILPE
jgi:ketosteroid isomerase-like protein